MERNWVAGDGPNKLDLTVRVNNLRRKAEANGGVVNNLDAIDGLDDASALYDAAEIVGTMYVLSDMMGKPADVSQEEWDTGRQAITNTVDLLLSLYTQWEARERPYGR